MSGNYWTETRRAVGVQLSGESLVPVVVMKAAGRQVDHVVQEAHKQEVPVIESKRLSASLYRMPVDSVVTPDLFPLLAALLAHVIQVDKVVGSDRGTS